MIEFLTYDLKVAVLLAVFYMFYRLLLARETFHHVNRLVLLTTAVASFVLPLCVITFHETVTMQAVASVSVGDIQMGVMDEDTSTPWWQMVLPILYILGVMATLGYTLWSLFRILSLIRHSERHPQADGITICVTDNAEMAPFSWMHYIVMNRDDFKISDSAILAHERGHIRLHHSWDLILVDTLTALQWFNPAMWMLRSDLRAIHEYEADGVVLSQGINARQYQYLLITKAAGIGGYSLANGISHSTLKNRINMMLHKKSPRQSYLKLLALLPIVAVALALNAETVTDVVYQQPQKKMVKKGKKNATIKMGSTNDIMVIEQPPAIQEKVEPVEMPNALEVEKQDGAFDVVEEMPQYPGGPKALFEFLSNTVNYPEEAEKAGTQGRVIATFVVEKDGSISGAKVVKSVDPLLDAEALRVINAMPNWTPGKQNGKVVRVKYTVPISFNLDGNNDSPKIVGIPNLEGYSLMVDGEKTDIGLLKELSPFKLKSMSINKKEKSVTVTTFKSPVVQHILYYLLSAREKAKNETGREINTNNQTITINGKVMTLNEIEESSLSMKNLGPVIVDDSYNIIVNTK